MAGIQPIGWHKEKDRGGELVPWTYHPQLRTERGDANHLRVVMR
jgi:hypothetical protein